MATRQFIDSIVSRITDTLTARRDNYDSPTPNFQRIAALWSVILGKEVTPEQVALCMAALKIARLMYEYTDDGAIDLAGYALCLMEIIEDQKTPHIDATNGRGTVRITGDGAFYHDGD